MAGDEHVVLIDNAREALRELLLKIEPGRRISLHVALGDLNRMAESERRGVDDAARREAFEREQQATLDRRRTWRVVMTNDQRRRCILEALGDDRLTPDNLCDRVCSKYNVDCSCECVRGHLRDLMKAGEVDRAQDATTRQLRYVYFRRAKLSGPIADLERAFHDEPPEGVV